MQPVPDLPSAFAQYRAAGGVLEFALFADSDGSEGDLIIAMRAAIPPEFELDEPKLLELGSREIGLAEFLGNWCNPASGRLIWRGNWYAKDGREFLDPEFASLQGAVCDGSLSIPPDAGSGGHYAYGFLCPPTALAAEPIEIQTMFDAIRGAVFPAGQDLVIRDWSSPDLREASEYFASGYDEWGIFLFTIYQPHSRRLAAIAASAAF